MIASAPTDQLQILLGDGRGGFSSSLAPLSQSNPGFLASGDFDADGDADLVRFRQVGVDYYLDVHLGHGDGTFDVPGIPITIGDYAYSIAVADLDRDGRDDIVLASLSGVQRLRSNGDGSFTLAPIYPFTTPGWEALAVGLLNADPRWPTSMVTDGRTRSGTTFSVDRPSAPRAVASSPRRTATSTTRPSMRRSGRSTTTEPWTWRSPTRSISSTSSSATAPEGSSCDGPRRPRPRRNALPSRDHADDARAQGHPGSAALRQLAYLVVNGATGDAIAIDPAEAGPLLEAAEKVGASINTIFNTHHHFDHCGANEELGNAAGAPVQASAIEGRQDPQARGGARAGAEVVDVNGFTAKVLRLPGTPTATWATSSARTSSPATCSSSPAAGGSSGTPAEMYASLNATIGALSDDTRVWCGHDTR
ncbi:MAG: MBL fold metallo-hydrolase [Deltaproteobacteria bacterium]|nr:MBL fold metallo-hydrolase [Deltaproteobacteria bacterium]